jgi:hypothetical protein
LIFQACFFVFDFRGCQNQQRKKRTAYSADFGSNFPIFFLKKMKKKEEDSEEEEENFQEEESLSINFNSAL